MSQAFALQDSVRIGAGIAGPVIRFLDRQNGRPMNGRRKAALALLRALVGLLAAGLRIRFPERVAGGDWWVYRWRLCFLLGWLEPESIAWCRRIIRPGMVVLDIGAHLGYYTRLCSRLAGSGGRILAFEPCPENFPLLKGNLPRRRYGNVTLLDKAASAETGRATLFVAAGHSMHSLNRGYADEQGRVDVEAVALDDFLPSMNIGWVDFVKIDVEGAEPAVLKGMCRTAERSPGLAMLVEYNPPALRAGGVDPPLLSSLLAEMGFDSRRILADGSLGEIDPSSDETVNLLCVRGWGSR